MAISSTIITAISSPPLFLSMITQFFNCSCAGTSVPEVPLSSVAGLSRQSILAAATGPGTVLYTATTTILALALACALAATVSDTIASKKPSWKTYVRRVLRSISDQQLIVATIIQCSILATACTMTRLNASTVWSVNVSTIVLQLLALMMTREGNHGSTSFAERLRVLATSWAAMLAVVLSTMDNSDPTRAVGCSPFFPSTLHDSIGGIIGISTIAFFTLMRLFVIRRSLKYSDGKPPLTKTEQLVITLTCSILTIIMGKQFLGTTSAKTEINELETAYMKELNMTMEQVLIHGPAWNISHFLPLLLLSLPLYSLARAFVQAVQDAKIEAVFDIEASAGLSKGDFVKKHRKRVSIAGMNKRDTSPSATGVLVDPFQPKRRSWGI